MGYIVAEGRAVTQNGKMFVAGTEFPAEEFGLSRKQINQLVDEGALVPGGKKAKAEAGGGLEDLSKAELLEQAEALGIEVADRATKAEIIALIEEAKAE